MDEAVLELEDERWAALVGNNFDRVDELTHPDLSYTHSNALVDTKESWLTSVTTGFVDYRSVEREDLAIISTGSTAVITGKATFVVQVQDNDITIVARFTSVWVNEGGQWRFFAWQNTPFPS